MNTRTFCSVLGILSIAPVALGQTPQAHRLATDADSFGFSWQKPPLPDMTPQSVTRNITLETAEQQTRYKRQAALDHDAAVSLSVGDYVKAEAEARQAISFGLDYGVAYEILAETLTAQGRTQEALQVYRVLAIDGEDGALGQTRYLLPYAQLLLKSGQWRQALTVYNRALPSLPDAGPHPEQPTVHDKDLMRANSRFSPDVSDPAGLETALHIARGLVYSTTPGRMSTGQDVEAMGEYAKALRLAPNSPLTNYYYGVGWQRLAPADRAKFGTAQQARAALEKAAKSGKPAVKEAATQALRVAMKP